MKFQEFFLNFNKNYYETYYNLNIQQLNLFSSKNIIKSETLAILAVPESDENDCNSKISL